MEKIDDKIGDDINIDSDGDVNFAKDGATSIFNKNIYYADDFFESWDLKFEEEYIENSVNEEILKTAFKQKALILNDQGNTNLSQYIAYNIQNRLNENIELSIKGKKWTPDLIAQEFIINLQKEKEKSIYVLYGNFSPNFYESLPHLIKSTQDCKNYVIISTDISIEDLKLEDHLKKMVSNVYFDNIRYSPEYIAEKIYGKIKKDRILSKTGIGKEVEKSKSIYGIDLRSIAIKIEKLEYVDFLIYELKIQEPESETEVINIIDFIKNDIQINGLKKWYNYILDDRQKLLTLGLSFFEGLNDDQFFAAMESLIEKSWRRRDPFFKAIDFIDFEELQSYYSLSPTIAYHNFDNFDMRWAVINFAWFTHRRQIFSSLGVLNDLVKNSVKNRYNNNELYGNQRKRIQIRNAISNSLSCISLVSLKNEMPIGGSPIENALLQLAADDSLKVQKIVGWTLASWVKYGYREEFFEIITNWQEKSSAIEFLRNIFRNENQEDQYKNPLSFIRSTIILSLGFSSLYMQNGLDPNIIEMLERFLKDKNPLVNERFANTLPTIVKFHFMELQDFLLEAIRYTIFRYAIGFSISRAYLVSPKEVIERIESWYKLVNEDKNESTNKNVLKFREAMCAVISITYGFIDYDAYDHLTIEDGMKRIRNILNEEKHPYVRKEAILAIINLTGNKNFSVIEAELQSLLAEITTEECDEIILKFVEIYLQQRQNLKNPEDTINIKYKSDLEENYEIGIWIDSKRPLTDIEKILKRWIKEGKNTVSRQIALRTFFQFAEKVGLKEKKHIDKIIKSREEYDKETGDEENDLDEKPEIKPSDRYQYVISSFFKGIYSFLASLPDMEYRDIIKDLLPEALLQKRNNKETINLVIEDWLNDKDSEFKTLSKKLRLSLFLASYGLVVIIFSVIFLMIVF